MRVPFLTFLILLGGAAAGAAAGRPNIVVILSDDMGFSDLGCYGGELPTPNLDALAAGGLRFTQFYNAARCCPTRASLLTGLHPHEAGVGHMTEDRGHDGYRGELNRRCLTIAEVLRPSGYRTGITGKWHVTGKLAAERDEDRANWPLQRGFDFFYGTIIGGGSYFDPSFLTRGNETVSAFADPAYRPEQGPYYYTDAIAEHAVRFVKENAAGGAGRPFFLYVAFTAAHWPLQAKEEDVARWKGKFAAGREALRRERLARMRRMGIVREDATALPPLPPGEEGTPHAAWEQRNMEVYAAMVESMDRGIGRLVSALRETGQLENTAMFYLQDNGACAEDMGHRKVPQPRPDKPTLAPQPPEFLQTLLIPTQTRDGYPMRQGKGVMAGGADTYIGYGEPWAAVSNTPFREYKHWVHEGGISTPLIVHWPAGIPAEQRGSLRHDPGHLVDIMATCRELAGADYPSQGPAGPLTPLRGVSLVPAFRGEPLKRAEPLCWEHEGNRAVREGDWKLVAKAGEPWALHDIAHDRSEQLDLATRHPDKVARLAAAWEAWAARSHVLPLGTWKAKPAGAVRRVTLRAGEERSGDAAPAVGGRAFTVTAAFRLPDKASGVIAAQGGSAHGWALWVRDGRLRFTVRRGGIMEEVSVPAATGRHRAEARLRSDGTPALKLAGGAEAAGKASGLLQQPVDGIVAGSDPGGRVGDWSDAFPFSGEVEEVTVE